IAAWSSSVLNTRGRAQARPTAASQVAMRVVATGLSNPFLVVWGPDDYLWVTERTAGRIARRRASDGSAGALSTIGQLLLDGPNGMLGRAIDAGRMKGTGSNVGCVTYT